VDKRAFVSRLAPARIEDVGEPPLPARDWVRVETTFSGLCGSDVKQILLNGSRDNPLTRGLDLTPVITHRFPLARWDEAVLALKDSRRTGAVKVLLEPG
jgi:threonine dehydrogenase-like Zn-dependent dehydrogenase